MNDDTANGWGIASGVVLFLALGAFVIAGSIGQWQDQIAYRHTHLISGWKAHEGSVLSVARPDFSSQPPQTPAQVQFTDYYGAVRHVTLQLPYRAETQKTTEVDVSRDGSIYAPESFNYSYANTNWYFKGPRAAVTGFWPGPAIATGFIFDVVISIIGGCVIALVLHSLPNLRGRLGTR